MTGSLEVLRVYLTGGVRVEYGGLLIRQDSFSFPYAALAFAYFVCERGRPVVGGDLAKIFWPEAPPADADAIIRATTQKLRRALARHALRFNLAVSGEDLYELEAPTETWVDIEAAAEAIHDAEGELRAGRPAGAFGPSAVAHHIARRPFLVGESGPWVEAHRERLRGILVRALECRARVFLWNREMPIAIEAAKEAIALEPFRETAHQLLIRAYAALGNAADAKRAYNHCREVLAAGLGIEPSTQTQRVYQSTLDGDSSDAVAMGGPATVAPHILRPSGDLPADPGPLHGDASASSRPQPQMADSDARLVWELYAAALKHEPAKRDEYLERACTDPGIRSHVRSLLESHGLDLGNEAATVGITVGARTLTGSKIGNYVIQRELGRGGMGVVYLAQDVFLGRTVAVKALSPACSQSPIIRQRLLNEAKIAAGLSHPGIATVYALEEIGGELYLVCEYIPGAPLRALVESGPLPIVDVIDIGLQLARALAEAHTKGIVHRDIKPENVIKTPSGVIKVLDFGLARAEYAMQTRLTQTGMLVGTPAYLSPEQALGQDTDFRTDIFAFGLLLYELASGVNPFAAGTIPATIARIVDAEPPPLSEVQPQSVPELDRIVQRCLQKNPLARYRSTQEIVVDLELLRREMAGSKSGSDVPIHPAPRPSTPSRSRQWLINHHVILSVIYVALLFPAWLARDWLPSPWNSVFLLGVLAAAAAGTSLRLHVWFTAITFPNQFAEQHHTTSQWTRMCDLFFASIQFAAAVGISDMHAEFAMLFVAAAAAILVGSFVIEPATAKAAFGNGGVRL